MFPLLGTMPSSWALSTTTNPLRLEFVPPQQQKCM